MNKQYGKDEQFEWFKQKLEDKVNHIYQDYTVTDSYVEDYDRDGAKVTVECANRWIGWSWDLKYVIETAKKKLYEFIIEYGIANDNGERINYPSDEVYKIIFR